jgi:hexosaminidase
VVLVNQQLPGFTLKYTTDGKEPALSGLTYTSGITQKGTIKIKAFDASGRGSRTVTVINQ